MKCVRWAKWEMGIWQPPAKRWLLKPLDWVKSQGGVCRWSGQEPKGKPQDYNKQGTDRQEPVWVGAAPQATGN